MCVKFAEPVILSVCICISINSKGGGLALGQPARGLALGGNAAAAQRTTTGLGGVYFLFVVPSSLHPLLVTTCTLALTGGYQLDLYSGAADS